MTERFNQIGRKVFFVHNSTSFVTGFYLLPTTSNFKMQYGPDKAHGKNRTYGHCWMFTI